MPVWRQCHLPGLHVDSGIIQIIPLGTLAHPRCPVSVLWVPSKLMSNLDWQGAKDFINYLIHHLQKCKENTDRSPFEVGYNLASGILGVGQNISSNKSRLESIGNLLQATCVQATDCRLEYVGKIKYSPINLSVKIFRSFIQFPGQVILPILCPVAMSF